MVVDSAQLTDAQVEVIARLTRKMVILGAPAKTTGSVIVGPILTVYKFQPSGSTRVSQIEALAQDFALELGVEDVVVKRLPGDNSVSVFIPNTERKPVKFLETTNALWNVKDSYAIPLNLGITQTGEPLVDDLQQLPHCLIAGATGSGKSTLLTTLITSLVVCKEPTDVQFILSDTKGVDFRTFEGMKHLWCKVSYDVNTTISILEKLIEEMERRLQIIGAAGVRNVMEYNKTYSAIANQAKRLPYIVVVIDELADIMEAKGVNEDGEETRRKPGQDAVNKLAQKARASGIHMLAATQRPSVNIVSGTIKANFPARITFRLPSQFDSRTVINTTGAEHLLAQGDMFYLSPNKPGLTRAHAPLTRIVDIQATLETVARRMS